MLILTARGRDTRWGRLQLHICDAIHPRPAVSAENEDSMETRRLRLRKANLSFRAAAVKSRKNYRKQQTLRVARLKTSNLVKSRLWTMVKKTGSSRLASETSTNKTK